MLGNSIEKSVGNLLKRRDVCGYEGLAKVMAEDGYSPADTVIYFIGQRDMKTDQSWCPDCVASDVLVKAVLAEIYSHRQPIPANRMFVTCSVGTKEEWRQADSPFRTKLGISSVPTIIVGDDKHRTLSGNDVTAEAVRNAIVG